MFKKIKDVLEINSAYFNDCVDNEVTFKIEYVEGCINNFVLHLNINQSESLFLHEGDIQGLIDILKAFQ